MKILAIDTTGLVASVAIVDSTKTIAEFTTNHKKTHSETLMPMIENMFLSLNMDISEIDYIAVSNGPGSFTGLRIGVATAIAIAHGSNKLVIPVPTLDSLAYNIFDQSNIIVPIMDARRDQVYTAFYKRDGEKLIRLNDYMADNIDVVISLLIEENKNAIFLGDGIQVFREKILEHKEKFMIASANMNMQRASSVGVVAMQNIDKAVTYDKVEPFYLRVSQAEREYERKNINV